MQKINWSINTSGEITIDFAGDQEHLNHILRAMIRESPSLCASITGVVLEFWTACDVDCGDLKKMVRLHL
jgi:hypothetical protein